MEITSVDLDHTSFAVDDALAWGRTLRRELGAVPIAGEALPEFRYLLMYVGDTSSGARIELLDPTGPGFLARYLDRHGEGPHHLTFTVPDLRAAGERMRDLGTTVVGEDHDHTSWREAFVLPDQVHGVVVQLAQTDLAYPAPADLLRTRERNVNAFPSSRGATDPLWWQSIWDSDPVRSGRLGATLLASTDLDASRRTFADGLGAQVHEVDGRLRCSWPSGSIIVHAAERPGVTGMHLDGGPAAGLSIGPSRLHHERVPDPVQGPTNGGTT